MKRRSWFRRLWSAVWGVCSLQRLVRPVSRDMLMANSEMTVVDDGLDDLHARLNASHREAVRSAASPEPTSASSDNSSAETHSGPPPDATTIPEGQGPTE